MAAKQTLAWNIRRLRVERGIAQERLAFDANVDRSYLGGLERAGENPTLAVLERIAGVLAVELTELFVPIPKAVRQPPRLKSGRKPQRVKPSPQE